MTAAPTQQDDPKPATPPPPGPASPRPPSGPRDLRVIHGAYRLDLLDEGQRVAIAIRTSCGWHIPTGRDARGEITWRSADTRDEAIAVMREVAGVAA